MVHRHVQFQNELVAITVVVASVIDCSWSEWVGNCPNCGRPTRTRTVNIQPSENGQSCGQEFTGKCSASLPPCTFAIE